MDGCDISPSSVSITPGVYFAIWKRHGFQFYKRIAIGSSDTRDAFDEWMAAHRDMHIGGRRVRGPPLGHRELSLRLPTGSEEGEDPSSRDEIDEFIPICRYRSIDSIGLSFHDFCGAGFGSMRIAGFPDLQWKWGGGGLSC
jgi:hypothetical protein